MNYFGFPLTNPFRSHLPRNFYDKEKGHSGIDVVMPIGTPIKSPCKGVVVKYRKQEEMGWSLYIQEPNGNVHVFTHLSGSRVSEGDEVEKNQVVALSGNTGAKTTAPHLHYEIIATMPQKGLEFMKRTLSPFKGWNIDPEVYLKERPLRIKQTARSRESAASARKYKGTPQGEAIARARSRSSRVLEAIKSFFNLK